MKFEDLPKEIQAWVGSEQFVDLVIKLRDHYGFRSRPTALTSAVSLLIYKQVGPEDFGEVLRRELDSNNLDKINSLIKETKDTVLVPIKEPLKIFGIDIELIKPLAVESMESSKPLSPQQKVSAGGTPFILHKEEELKTTEATKPSLARPIFYKPPNVFTREESPRPEAARLELGIEEKEIKKEPATVKVGDEKARIVHYSDLRTALDPFGRPVENIPPQTQSPQQAKKENKKIVHPDNVINLKDLPL